MKNWRLIALFLCLGFFISAGCAGRVPSNATSQKVIKKHFKKYGKKYKETDFGQHLVKTVEAGEISELQRKLAAVDAFVYLEEGSVYQVRVLLAKKAFGWKVESWENLGRR